MAFWYSHVKLVKQIPLFLSLPNKEAYSHSIIKETWPIQRLKPLSFHSCSLSTLFSFFPYRGSFLHRFPILSPAYQSHTSLSILVSYRLIRSSFFSRKNTFFSLESHSPPALSVAPTNCEQGSLHLLNIIRNIQFLNYARKLSEYYQSIIRKYYQNIIWCTRPFWAWISALAEYYPHYSVSKLLKSILRE